MNRITLLLFYPPGQWLNQMLNDSLILINRFHLPSKKTEYNFGKKNLRFLFGKKITKET